MSSKFDLSSITIYFLVMNTSASTDFPIDTQQKYRQNFARHILSVTLYMQSEIMNALTLKHGHGQLRINFEPYISIASQHGARLSDIAAMLGISRQAANQTANQIESAGYLLRAADPSDGRAKLLVTTPRAKVLIRQGAAEAMTIQTRFAAIIGDEDLSRLNTSLTNLSRALNLLFPYEGEKSLIMPATMPRLSDYISNRLQALTMEKGHPQLKRSFGAVLTAVGPHGGRIQQMADARDVSKQAISAIATELEELGYIVRTADPQDARQIVLQFTDSGRGLIADSVDSVDQLAAEFACEIGDSELQHATQAVGRIYRSLHLEEDIFGHTDNHDIRIMARQINRQLGDQGARALARLLLSGESEN
ncbi:MAG: MarR family transcriptional regulator [Halioglobus sp.]